MPNPYAEKMRADAEAMGLDAQEMAVLDALMGLSQRPAPDVADLMRRDQATAVTALEGRYPGDPPFVHNYAYGAYVTDTLGREAVDTHNGILSVTAGHNHPRVLIAQVRALTKGVWMPTSTHMNPEVVAFKEALIKSLAVPGAPEVSQEDPRSWRVLPASGGNIAGDNARRVADGFSFDESLLEEIKGETLTLAEQALGDNIFVMVPLDAYSGNGSRGNADCGLGVWRGVTTPTDDPKKKVFMEPTIDGFERALKEMPPSKKPVLHMEQILGLGGFIVIPTDVLKHMVRRVHELGGLFIADEVQTAPARTGEGFWYWHSWTEGDPMLEPDMVVFAKGFGNGRPVAGVAMRKAINDRLLKLQNDGAPIGKWFDTNALPPAEAAVGTEVIKLATAEDWVKVSREMGGEFRKELLAIGREFPQVVDSDQEDGGLAGSGLMSGLRLRNSKLIGAALKEGPAKGILFGAGGREPKTPEDFRGGPNTLRIAPAPGAMSPQVLGDMLQRTRDIIRSLRLAA